MDRSSVLTLAMLTAACAPPPVPAGFDTDGGGGAVEPSVEILFPPADVGEIALRPDGVLEVFIVADVEGLTYVSPLENKEDVPGEGHFHFNVNDAYRDAPPAQFYTFLSNPDEFKPGDRVKVSVTLATNTHIDLDSFAGWIDVVEFNVVAAPAQ